MRSTILTLGWINMSFKIKDAPEFYQGYIEQVLDAELIDALRDSSQNLVTLCGNLDETLALYRYEEDKWSIKDLIQHLIDAERVFCYRAMRFARNDQTELSGFDQDDYVKQVFADKFLLQDILDQFKNIRQCTLDLFSLFNETELEKKGMSNGVEMSVEMIGYIISGHTVHHHNIIKEKYLT